MGCHSLQSRPSCILGHLRRYFTKYSIQGMQNAPKNSICRLKKRRIGFKSARKAPNFNLTKAISRQISGLNLIGGICKNTQIRMTPNGNAILKNDWIPKWLTTGEAVRTCCLFGNHRMDGVRFVTRRLPNKQDGIVTILFGKLMGA